MQKLYFLDKVLTYGNMRRALNKVCRDVRWKDSVVGYELHAPRNTYQLIDEIKRGVYKISPYQRFTIYEPKKRNIVATRIRDRQFQMALCSGGLYEDITEHFIHDNCACQIGKGTDFALKRVKTHLRRYYQKHGKEGWVLKLDIKQFFPSTKHSVAKEAVAKRVSDPYARRFVFDVIDSFEGDAGIGLGSQISQLVELAVLDDLDHYIKERLGVKHYIRYMDDMIFTHHDKEFLKYVWSEVEKELAKIDLELNKKSCIYPLSQGVKFLKWRFIVTNTGKIVQQMDGSKQSKERQRLKALLTKESKGDIPKGTAQNSLQAWLANADRGDTFFQQKRMIEYYKKTEGELNNGKSDN